MKLKKLLLVVLLVLSVCIFPACTQDVTEQNLLEVDDSVTVLVPEARWIFGLDENGVAKDGARYLIDEILSEANAETPVNAPFTLRWRSDITRASYTFYDMDGTELTWRSDKFTVPEEPGTYICIAESVFGTEKVYDGYQFLFCFTLTEQEA